MIKLTPEATALIDHTLVVHFNKKTLPPPHHVAVRGYLLAAIMILD
jgi:hypothetical protein